MWEREILVPDEELTAWLLCDLNDPPKGPPKWLISPHDVEPQSSHGVLLLRDNTMDEYGKGFRVAIPKKAREMGWLPEKGELAVVLSDYAGLSIWKRASFDTHCRNLSRQLAGSG